MIAEGNEDRMTWIRMLAYLKEACPIVSRQGRRQDLVDNDALLCAMSFVFVSDRDKGLKEAVKQVSCAQLIQVNVTQRFGIHASRFIMATGKTYSARYVDYSYGQSRRSEAAGGKEHPGH